METKNLNSKKAKLSAVAILCALALFCAVLVLATPATSASAYTSQDGLQWQGGATPKQLTEYTGFTGGGRTDALPTFDGGKMPIGHYGSNFFLGFDENGNFAAERSAGSGSGEAYGTFGVSSRVKSYVDGFSTAFRFDPTPLERGAPEAGGTFAVGLGNDTDLNAFFNIVFRYNGTDLDMYLILVNMDHGYNMGGGVYNKANLVELSTLATRTFAKPKLGEKIELQLNNITKAEADAYNADSSTTKSIVMDEGTDNCWRWSVNGVIIETPGFKGPVFDALSLPKDANGDHYGYLWADCNMKSSWEMLNASNLAGAGGAYVKANLSGRLTIFDIVYDGSAGGQPIQNSVMALPETESGAAAGDFSYAVNPAGVYKGKTTLSSNGTYSLQYTAKAKLNAFETNFALKKIDEPNGGSYRVMFKKTSTVGNWNDGAYSNDDPYFGIVFTKTAWRSMAVALLINGVEYPTEYTAESPYTYDFKNGGEVNVQLFYSSGTAFLVFNGRALKCNAEIAAVLNSFDKDGANNPEGYIYLQNDFGSSRTTLINMITDGTAVQKPIVTRVEMPSDKTLAYADTTYTNPETVKVYFSDGEPADWNVTWAEKPNTKSAQTYTIKGVFSDLEALKENYLITPEIADSLKFNVTVQLDPAFIKSENLGAGYDKTTGKTTIGAEGYRWHSVYSVQIPYLYKQDDGYVESETDKNKYEHLMSEPSQANRQFHTSDLVRKDVDGYEVEFSITNHSPAITPDVFIMLTASPGHPEQIGQGNVGIRLISLDGQTKMHPQIITWMNGASGGLPDGAAVQIDGYFQKGDETPVHNIDFDYTGNTMYKLKWSLSGEEGSRKVDMTLILPDGTEYTIVGENGEHIDKADYQFNGDEPTILAPNGQFVNEKGYLFFWVEQGYNEITFRQHYKEYGASYSVPADKSIANGTALADLGLPSSISVLSNKNSKLTGSVVYSGYDPTVLGTQSVTGTVTLPQGMEFEDNLPEAFTVNVTVLGMITSISSPLADMKIKAGAGANFPTKFTATLNGGVTAEIEFIWIGDYDPLTLGEYTLTATPLGFYEYADGAVPMSVKITVEKAKGCNSFASPTIPSALFIFVLVVALAITVIVKKKIRA